MKRYVIGTIAALLTVMLGMELLARHSSTDLSPAAKQCLKSELDLGGEALATRHRACDLIIRSDCMANAGDPAEATQCLR